MFTNSPGGNLGFESSPFKLTEEFVDLMDGTTPPA
jgi:phosphatidylinositol kinase/protein kinase (PI-3  family)